MKHALALCLAVAVIAASRTAASQTLAAWDDARACAPLEGGGLAVATGAGLAIVDGGGRVRSMTSLEGLPGTRVLAVEPDGESVWAGTESGAARVALGGSALRVTRTVGIGAVAAVRVTGNGVWLADWSTGLVHVEGERIATIAAPRGAKRIVAIAEHRGAVHVAFADGPPARLEDGALRPLSGPVHGQALASAGDALLVGDLEGVFRSDRRLPLSTVDARGLATKGGELFVATWGSGLLRTKLPAESALAPTAVSDVPREVRAVATRGAVTCAATTSGVFVDRGSGRFERVAIAERSLPSNDITALAASGTRMAVGTFDRGAVVVDGARVTPVAGVATTDTVNALAWQGDRLWVATARGLVRVEASGAPRRLTTRDGLPSASVRALLVDGTRLVVGTDEGVAIVEGDIVTPLVTSPKGRAGQLGSPKHATWALAKRADGALLVGTTSGLYVGKPGGAFARHAVATGALDDDWVTALAASGDDVLVGTYAHGVTKLRFRGETPEVERLGGGYVNPGGLRVEAGRVLASTMDGLLVRDAKAGATWEVDAKASPGRDVTAVAWIAGTRWVASRRGIAIGR